MDNLIVGQLIWPISVEQPYFNILLSINAAPHAYEASFPINLYEPGAWYLTTMLEAAA